MAEIDAEFRTAYAAFLRSWIGPEFFARGLEDMVEQLVNQRSPVTQIFRAFHAEHGRYPEFEEICPPGGPLIGMLSDMH